MPKVYTGKVVIPGNKIDEYIKMLMEAEKEREPFVRYASELNQAFVEHLFREGYSGRTVDKHSSIVHWFIDFLARHTDVWKFEEVTIGIANTHFKKWFGGKIVCSYTQDDVRVALTKFFKFLAEEKGIVNEKVLKGLR